MPPEGQTVRRRLDVARRYLQGESQWAIARRHGVNQSTISRDLEAIQAAWLASAVADLDAKKAKELARLDMIEREACRGWRRSLRMARKLTVKRDVAPPAKPGARGGLPAPPPQVGPSEETAVTEAQAGDPRFLTIMVDCTDKRLRVMGAYSDPKDRDREPVIAELVLRVLGPGLSMSELCGGRVLNAGNAVAEES